MRRLLLFVIVVFVLFVAGCQREYMGVGSDRWRVSYEKDSEANLHNRTYRRSDSDRT